MSDKHDHLNDFYLVGFSGPLRSNDMYAPIELLEKVESGVLSEKYRIALSEMIEQHLKELECLAKALQKSLGDGPDAFLCYLVGRIV